jgi:tRNA G18 (ribose-2'-O)-methylase SpoU
VSDPDDPLLVDFVALNDPERRREVERRGDYFVVEGALAIERLLSLPRWQPRAIVLLAKLAHRMAPLLAGTDAPVAVCDEAVLRSVVGFDLHRGALASVARQAPASFATADVSPSARILVAEGVNDHENLGALYRNAAAFGAAAVALDPHCADPFYRRAVRVSLGHVLAVPTVTVPGGADLVPALRSAGLVSLALTPSGELPLGSDRLDGASLGPTPVAVIVGAEGAGLSPEVLGAADHRVAIEMVGEVDSLNVATAAAIALHRLQDDRPALRSRR